MIHYCLFGKMGDESNVCTVVSRQNDKGLPLLTFCMIRVRKIEGRKKLHVFFFLVFGTFFYNFIVVSLLSLFLVMLSDKPKTEFFHGS